MEVEEKALKLRFVKNKQTLKVSCCHSPSDSVVGVCSLGAVIGSCNSCDSMKRLRPFAHCVLCTAKYVSALWVGF